MPSHRRAMRRSPASTRYRFRLPITHEADLRLFTESAFGVRVPVKAVCPGHVAPWEAFTEAYFAHARVTVWKASRGFGGKSTLLALLGLTEAVTLRADVTIAGGSGLQSQRVHEAEIAMWAHPGAPRSLLRRQTLGGRWREGDPLRRETRLAWGNRITALTASTRAARGPHPQRLRVDEVDEMDAGLLDTLMGQPLSGRGVAAQTVLSSTQQYADGTMAAVRKRAAERGWPVREWCMRETMQPHGWLPPPEIEAKRGEVTEQAWLWEYELQEPNPQDRAFAPGAVAAAHRRELGALAGDGPAEFEAPQPGARYATGADWARVNDWTVIETLRTDAAPARVVAWERTRRRPWPEMLGRLEARLRRYPGRAAHDATGLGDALGAQAGFVRVPPGAVLEDVVMVGRDRSDLLGDYIVAVEHGRVQAPGIAVRETEHRFAAVRDLYGPGHLPDTIAAAALAWRAAGRPAGAGPDQDFGPTGESRWRR